MYSPIFSNTLLLNKLISFRGLLRAIKMNSRKAFVRFFILTFLLAFFPASTFAAVQQDFIAPPKYSTVDAFGVNVSGNQVAPNVDTLSIGGAMGLSHSITLQGNLFTFDHGNHGYTDKYAGGLKYVQLGRKMPLTNTSSVYETLWALSATAMGDSVQFVQMCNGLFVDDLSNTCTAAQKASAPFEAIHDKRHTLGVKGSDIVWTKPDGTEVYFPGSILNRGTSGPVMKIVYPTGFTVYTASAYSVTTNTGFQLKYDFVSDTRGLENSKIGRYNDVFPSTALNSTIEWWRKNPKYIRAINNAYEYCDQLAPCNFANPWPTVTFDWPGGMPKAFYIDNSVFRVTNPVGATAEFHYQAQDAVIINGAVLQNYTANTHWAPRLVAIKPFGATQATVNYTYKNKYHLASEGDPTGTSHTSAWISDNDPGILTQAAGMKGTSAYSEARLQYDRGASYIGHRTQVLMIDYRPSILEKVTLDGGARTVEFETTNQRNFITNDSYLYGSSKTYQYFADSNNVNTVTDQASGTYEAGGYPPSCINPTPDRNRKTCNQPGWVKHNGNMMSYTYHEASGQIKSVTSPPNKNGISAVTRYGYEQKFANYIQAAGGSKLPAPTGIWLKTSEKTCINTSTLGDACVGNGSVSAAQDEVITRYEYNADKNLSLIGMTVTVADTTGAIITKRTCYQYDIYGNRIGETQPKANLASCH
jgi:hypothetical protein